MTKITTLKFNSYGELQNQFVTWIKVLPSIFGIKCHLNEQTLGDDWQLIFESESLASYKSLHLHEVSQRTESMAEVDNYNNFEYLWIHLRWEKYDVKQDAIYCLLPLEKVSSLVRRSYRLKLFDIQYQVFQNRQVFLKIMFAPRYLILWINEQLNCCVYWFDSHGTFMTFGQRHPLASHWAQDDTLRLVSQKELRNLGNFDLRFKDIRDAVTWNHDFDAKTLVSVSDKLNIEIHIGLRKDNSRLRARASLWFYGREQRQELEDWITRLSRDQREEYLLLSSEAPFDGFFLRIKDEVRPEIASPLPTPKRFRKLYEGESVYVPADLRLEPDIPFVEFQKIFDPKIGTSIIFWQQENDLNLLKLEDVRFDELQSLVHYVLSDYEHQIMKTKSEMIFKDPRLVIYEWEAPETLESKISSGDYSVSDDLGANGLSLEVCEELEEVKTNNLVSVNENSESDSLERHAIIRQISDLQSVLLTNPTNDKEGCWLRLGHLEYTLGNHLEAIACFELGMFVMKVDAELLPQFRHDLLRAYLDLQDWNDVSKTSELFQRSSDADFSQKELIYLGYYLLANKDNLSEEQFEFFNRTYLVALEANLQDLPVASLCVIAFHAINESESNKYLLLKIKDYVLYSLFDRGLFNACQLPHFLVERKSLNFNVELVQNFHSKLERHFQSLGDDSEVLRNSAMFEMIFAVGFAGQKNSSMVNSSLEKAKRLIRASNDQVLKVLSHCYEEVAFKVLNEDELGLRTSDAMLDELTQAQRYKANRLIDKSFILRPGEVDEASDLINHDIVGLRDRTDEELVNLIPQKLKALEMESNIPRERLSYKRKQLFCAILDSLPRLGENFTFQILEEVYREYNALNSLEHRGSVLGKMLSLAYLFNRNDWITTLYNDFLILTDQVETHRLKAMTELLQPVVEYFPKMVPKEECLGLVKKVLLSLKQDLNSQKIRILLVRVLDSINEEELSRGQLSLVLDIYLNKKIDDQQSSLDLFQFFLFNARNYTCDLKAWLCEELLSSFQNIKDHLSVNEHFSLSKVLAMEFMIYASPNDVESSPELNNFMMELEFMWKKQFFEWLRSVGIDNLEA